MDTPMSIEATLVNAATGMIDKWYVEGKRVLLEYHNGSSEVIWFKSNASAVIFSNAIKQINSARELKLEESYFD